MRTLLRCVAASLPAACLSVIAQVADIKSDQLKTLIGGHTIALAFYGDLSDAARTAYWDFKSDGKLCTRLTASPAGTKCADNGTWRMEGEVLCWQLGWLGKTDGFDAACGFARPDGDAYQFINQKSGHSLMKFRPRK